MGSNVGLAATLCSGATGSFCDVVCAATGDENGTARKSVRDSQACSRARAHEMLKSLPGVEGIVVCAHAEGILEASEISLDLLADFVNVHPELALRRLEIKVVFDNGVIIRKVGVDAKGDCDGVPESGVDLTGEEWAIACIAYADELERRLLPWVGKGSGGVEWCD